MSKKKPQSSPEPGEDSASDEERLERAWAAVESRGPTPKWSSKKKEKR